VYVSVWNREAAHRLRVPRIVDDNCTAARAREIGERLVQALNPLSIEWEGSNYTIGASLGVALSGSEIPNELAWLKLADGACYEAKREGRGQLRIAAVTA
jgi:GGDEF domain-containing protein